MPSNVRLKRSIFFYLTFGVNAHSIFAWKIGEEIFVQSMPYRRNGDPEERFAVGQQKNGQQI
jgi:hypothetical protein